MTTPKRLYRRSASGRLGGVCAGFAEYMDADVTLIRLVAILLAIVPGGIVGGVIGYVLAWMIMQDEPGPMVEPAQFRRLTRSTGDRRIAGVCGGLAEYFNIDSTLVRVLVALLAVFAGAVIFGVIGYLIAWFIMPDRETGQVVVTASVV
jgi:phage shock protein PspC (stress-responsive transcriptional regulator)